MDFALFIGGVREEGDPRRGIKKKLSRDWGKRRMSKVKEGELYKLGVKWGCGISFIKRWLLARGGPNL